MEGLAKFRDATRELTTENWQFYDKIATLSDFFLFRFDIAHRLTFFAGISCRSAPLQRNATSPCSLQKHSLCVAAIWPRASKF